jgi:leucyl aminopeptidase
MKYSIKSGDPAAIRTQCLVVGVFEARQLSAAAAAIDQATGGLLSRMLRQGDLDPALAKTQMLYDLPGVQARRVLVVGLGKAKECSHRNFAKAVEAATRVLEGSRAGDATYALPETFADKSAVYAAVRDLVLAAAQATYRFDQCKSEVEPPKHPLQRIAVSLADGRQKSVAERALAHGAAMAQGMQLAKDLANLPGNICTPAYLADQARQLGRKSRRLKVTVLEEKDMKQLGMGALLSVSRGSRQPAKLIVMEYKGGKAGSKPVALVGKGLTFDAGGISIKPAANMDEMKYDMCGGASVLGTIAACLAMQLPLNVVGVVPASENLPDGAANKPGDIVTSMSGQTIEVLNTDAEGRLILCDALTYTERYEPAAVVDIATLTGACIVALGHQAAGLLANDDAVAQELLDAGTHTGDRAWRLPLWEEYQEQLKSNFADMANIGGPPAGTITAACFLSRFAKKFKWAHLDIAGIAWKSGAEKGATGRPVPLLTQFLLQRCRLAE